jgi:hypothetical protein
VDAADRYRRIAAEMTRRVDAAKLIAFLGRRP